MMFYMLVPKIVHIGESAQLVTEEDDSAGFGLGHKVDVAAEFFGRKALGVGIVGLDTLPRYSAAGGRPLCKVV